jgi:hypothetical protein
MMAPVDCSTGTTVVGISLELVGATFALVASVSGMRMKPEDYGQISETGRVVFGSEKLVRAMQKTSRLLFWAALAIFAGIGVHVWNLVTCLVRP